MNLIKKLTARLRVFFERDHDILRHTIRLPRRHMLDWLRLNHQRYDMPLADVSGLVVRKYPGASMIDIGANVGDTAAFMTATDAVPILCVEGNPEYLPFLKRNLNAISKHSEIVSAYVGATDGAMAGRIMASHGTAKLVDGDGNVPTRSLPSILEDYPKFKQARLIKIDTDGQDAKIITGAIETLSAMKPVIFVEYYPLGAPEVATECREMLLALAAIGYSNFHVFDNFGNHMLRLPASQLDHHMRSLNAYVRSTQKDLRPSLFYYDICAFPSDDTDLSDKMLTRYVGDVEFASIPTAVDKQRQTAD